MYIKTNPDPKLGYTFFTDMKLHLFKPPRWVFFPGLLKCNGLHFVLILNSSSSFLRWENKNILILTLIAEKRQKFDNGEDPLDPEEQAQGGGGPFWHQGFNPFGGGGFQFKFHFN